MTIHTPLILAFVLSFVAPSACAQDRDEATTAHEKLELRKLIDLNQDKLELSAWWDDFEDSTYRLFERHKQLQGFRPAKARAAYPADAFLASLPERRVSVGEIWEINPDLLLPFAQQFHSGATSRLRSGRNGAYACLRAINKRYAEVQIRAHLGFLLEKTDDGSTFLTPAQFVGRLVLDRRQANIRSFHLFLPSQNSNVDVVLPAKINIVIEGVEKTKKAMIADIGFIPRMELFGGAPLVPNTEWQRKISDQQARMMLSEKFYAFAKIPWLPIEEGVKRARELRKPLHVVTLFGSLDDESC